MMMLQIVIIRSQQLCQVCKKTARNVDNKFLLIGSLVPGCNRSYQEICTEFTRDHMINNQSEYSGLVASRVVAEIRVSFFYYQITFFHPK